MCFATEINAVDSNAPLIFQYVRNLRTCRERCSKNRAAVPGSGEAVSFPTATLRYTVGSNNTDLEATFGQNLFVSASGTYVGLVSGDADTASNKGYFSAQVTPLGQCTVALSIGSARFALKGVFDDLGNFQAAIRNLPHHGNGALNLKLDLTNAAHTLDGTVVINGVSSQIVSNQAVAQNAGRSGVRYTLTIPHPVPGAPGIPGGDGYGSVLVTKTGSVQFVGMLGDGTPVAQATFLDKDGSWPLYIPLYGNAGSITGWLSILPSGLVSGNVEWFKPAVKSVTYPNGFTLDAANNHALQVKGALLSTVAVTGTRSATLDVVGGALQQPVSSIPFSINGKGVGTASHGSKFTLKIVGASGLFTGSFLDEDTPRRQRKFSGANIAQPSGPPNGFGIFRGDNASTGAVEF